MDENISGLDFLVFVANDMDVTVEFYRSVGLDFKKEQHGSSPLHYSTKIEDRILEIYPGGDGVSRDKISFKVGSLDLAMRHVNDRYVEKRDYKLAGLRSARLMDPDGRTVFLRESD